MSNDVTIEIEMHCPYMVISTHYLFIDTLTQVKQRHDVHYTNDAIFNIYSIDGVPYGDFSERIW